MRAGEFPAASEGYAVWLDASYPSVLCGFGGYLLRHWETIFPRLSRSPQMRLVRCWANWRCPVLCAIERKRGLGMERADWGSGRRELDSKKRCHEKDFLAESAEDGSVALLVKYLGHGGSVSIPPVMCGLPVTRIGQEALMGKNIRAVEIPDTVTYISSGAFMGNHIASIRIPAAVVHIGSWAFADNELTFVEIPRGVTRISAWAFAKNRLTRVLIPDGVTDIGAKAFAGNELSEIAIPCSVVAIEEGAFLGNSIAKVEIPRSASVSWRAFHQGVMITRQ